MLRLNTQLFKKMKKIRFYQLLRMDQLEFIKVKKMNQEYFQKIQQEIMIMLDAYVQLGFKMIVSQQDIKILLLENLTKV